ncbi:MAG: hypothetical protein AABY01_05150 [Nanoarchaeota archaeon]
MNIFIWIGIGAVLLWALNGLLREYLIAKILHQNYQRRLRTVLTHPEARPKGRFD